MYYPFDDDHATLFARVHSDHDYTIVGLELSKIESDEQCEYFAKGKKLEGLGWYFGDRECSWAWHWPIYTAYALRKPTAEHLKMLSDKNERERIVHDVVQPLREAWELLKPA